MLMLWRRRFVSDRWGWKLPGGLVNDDVDPATTAMRELIEEAGYRPCKMRHLTRFQPTVDMVDSWHDVYLGEGAEVVGEPTEVNESARLEWAPLSSAVELIDWGGVWNSGKLVALLPALALRQREQS